MVMDPLPPINKVFYTVIQQERHMILEDPSISASISGTTNFSTNNYESRQRGRSRGYRGMNNNRFGSSGRFNTSAGRGRGQKLCTYCQRSGHTIDICYKKHGFPPGYQNSLNHINSFAEPEANSSQDENVVNYTQKEMEPELNLPFTPAQHTALRNMIQQTISQGNSASNQIICSIPTSSNSQERHNSGPTLLEDDWCS
ncbi:unnamed protein product [Lupinus luteus]|uniref:Uncharacterized protein n=1 Tax=Lupinus luteus TaxID=3873 RepID=A0AAV1X4A3_LUPLU